MKVLITGGLGFIGKRLSARLSKSNEATILGIDKSDAPNYMQKDILDDDLDLSPYDAVFHLAAVSLPGEAEKDRELAWKVNVEGTRNIAKRMRKGQTLVFMSSSHVYDKTLENVHKEDEACLPGNFYGLTKLVGEELIRFHSKECGYDHLIFRLFNSYSADQRQGLLVGDVIKKYREQDRIEIFNPDFVLDMVHIDDVIDVLSSSERIGSGTYNLCSGHPISIREVYRRIGGYVGAGEKEETIVSDKKGRMLGDNSRLKDKGFDFREFSL